MAPRTDRGRSSNSVPCPICGRTFALEDIAEHADICAARLERASKPPGKPAGRQQKRAPRRPQPARSSSTTSGRRKPQRPPTRLDAVGRREHQHRKGLDASIVVDVIEGMEFRSQISTALRRLHAPSPPPGAMQMDADDRWRQRQSWPQPQPMGGPPPPRFRQPTSRPEGHALPREASRAAESSGLASAAAAAAAAAEADGADQFLVNVKQTLGHGDKHRLFMEVMMGFQSGVLDTFEVMEHVSALLQGHWSLLRQFNNFLPAGHRIEQLPPRLQGYSVCHDAAQPVPKVQADELAVRFFDRLKERFGEHSSQLSSITHALVELATPESSLHDGELPLHSRPAEMLNHIRRNLHTREHEDLWREFCEYVPASWTSRDFVHTVFPASWAAPAGGRGEAA